MAPSRSQRLADCTASRVLSGPCDHHPDHHPQKTVINLTSRQRSLVRSPGEVPVDACKKFVGCCVTAKTLKQDKLSEGARAGGQLDWAILSSGRLGCRVAIACIEVSGTNQAAAEALFSGSRVLTEEVSGSSAWISASVHVVKVGTSTARRQLGYSCDDASELHCGSSLPSRSRCLPILRYATAISLRIAFVWLKVRLPLKFWKT